MRFEFRCNILISGTIIKEMPGSAVSGDTHCRNKIVRCSWQHLERRDELLNAAQRAQH